MKSINNNDRSRKVMVDIDTYSKASIWLKIHNNIYVKVSNKVLSMLTLVMEKINPTI